MSHRPERPEIVEAETPTTEEGWLSLVWGTVEEFVRITPAGSSGSGNTVHLSAHTFPGGECDEDDDASPYCGAVPRVREPYRRDVSVYPQGCVKLCRNCMYCFQQYHESGRPPTQRQLSPSRSEQRTQAEFLESLGITVE